MPSPSPICTVNGGSTTNGANVTAGSTVTIALASVTGANYWFLTCTSTDDGQTAAAVNATLVVNQGAKTATYTQPASACALIWQSTVGVTAGTSQGAGTDANGQVNQALTTTFGVFTLTPGGKRLIAPNQTTESSAAFGWSADLNADIKGGTLIAGTTVNVGVQTLTPVMAIADQTTQTLIAQIVARDQGTGNTYRATMTATFTRTGSTVTQVGTTDYATATRQDTLGLVAASAQPVYAVSGVGIVITAPGVPSSTTAFGGVVQVTGLTYTVTPTPNLPTQFTGAMMQGFAGTNSPTNAWIGPSNQSTFSLLSGQAIAVLFWWNGKAATAYYGDLLSNFQTSPAYKGWNIYWDSAGGSRFTCVLLGGASATTIVSSNGTAGPRLGLNCFAVTVTGGALRCCLNGDTTAIANTVLAGGTPSAPDSTCTPNIGAAYSGVNGFDLGGFIAAAHWTRALSDAELRTVSGVVLPAANGTPATRYALPLTGDASCDLLMTAASWDGASSTFTTTSPNGAGTNFSFTKTGALTKVALGEQWIDTLSTPSTKSAAIDTVTTVLEGDHVKGSGLLRYRFDNWDSSKNADIIVAENVTDVGGATAPIARSTLLVDGVYVDTLPQQALTLSAGYQTWALGLHGINVAPGVHKVEVYAPPQIAPSNTLPTVGGFVAKVVTPLSPTIYATTPAKRLVAGLDSIVQGYYLIAGSQGVGALLRKNFPTAGLGGTTLLGWGGYAIADDINGVGITGVSGSIAQLASLIVAQCQQVTGGGPKWFYDNEGFNTYNRNTQTPTAWATTKGQLYDAINAGDSTIKIVYTNNAQSHFNTLANAGGYTLAQFNTSAATIVTGRGAFVTFKDLAALGTMTYDAGFVHPDAPGAVTQEAAVRAAGGW